MLSILCIAVGLAALVGVVVYLSRRPVAPPAPEPRIVEAVASMASVRARPATAQLIEAAMSAAVRDCLAAGVSLSDTDTIRAAMLAARERVKREGN